MKESKKENKIEINCNDISENDLIILTDREILERYYPGLIDIWEPLLEDPDIFDLHDILNIMFD